MGCIGYMCYSLHQSAVFQWFSCNGQQLRAVLPNATVTCAFKVCKYWLAPRWSQRSCLDTSFIRQRFR